MCGGAPGGCNTQVSSHSPWRGGVNATCFCTLATAVATEWPAIPASPPSHHHSSVAVALLDLCSASVPPLPHLCVVPRPCVSVRPLPPSSLLTSTDFPAAMAPAFTVSAACVPSSASAWVAPRFIHSRRPTAAAVASPARLGRPLVMAAAGGEPPPRLTPEEAMVRAAMLCDEAAVTAALDAGVSANYASTQGDSRMTALMWAASEGSVPIAKALLAAGVNVNATNNTGHTALVYAFDNLPTTKPRPAPPAGFPGLTGKAAKKAPKQVEIRARVTGHAGVAKLLLVAGANPGVVSPYGETMLHLAARKGYPGLIDLLVSRGLDVNAVSKGYKHTAMHLAAIDNHAESIRVLASLGADVDAKNVVGWTPLLWAAATGNVDALTALVEVGADVNAKGSASGRAGDGETTPLREARKCGEAEKVSKVLIRAGAI